MTQFRAFHSGKIATVEQMFLSAVLSHSAAQEKFILQLRY